jgi:hypothetical protein
MAGAMNKALAALLLVATLAACTSSTEYGKCIGIADDKDPKLHYKLSVWNAFLGFIFVETIIVPVWVLADETFCPVGKK